MGIAMTSSFRQLKETMLGTSYSAWRRWVSTLVLGVSCLACVACFVYLYTTSAQLHCYDGFLGFSVIWLVVELAAIAYLHYWDNIPRFARDVIKMNIAFANIWFGLFIFSLRACVE